MAEGRIQVSGGASELHTLLTGTCLKPYQGYGFDGIDTLSVGEFAIFMVESGSPEDTLKIGVIKAIVNGLVTFEYEDGNEIKVKENVEGAVIITLPTSYGNAPNKRHEKHREMLELWLDYARNVCKSTFVHIGNGDIDDGKLVRIAVAKERYIAKSQQTMQGSPP